MYKPFVSYPHYVCHRISSSILRICKLYLHSLISRLKIKNLQTTVKERPVRV